MVHGLKHFDKTMSVSGQNKSYTMCIEIRVCQILKFPFFIL